MLLKLVGALPATAYRPGMRREDAPQPTNTVDLDPVVRDVDGIAVALLTYQPHAYEILAEELYVPKMFDIMGAARARFSAPAPMGDPPGDGHIIGTLRFGADPATSVCRPDGRFHDIGNLYGTAASLGPTSSGFNPTLTITPSPPTWRPRCCSPAPRARARLGACRA